MEIEYSDYEIWEFVKALQDMRPDFYFLALCRDKDLQEFFPGKGQSLQVRKSREVCMVCPVQFECLQYALDNKITHGVWGGSSPEQRINWIEKGFDAEEAWLETSLE